MSKRSRERDADDRPPKRSKAEGERPPPPVIEDIQFARQVQQLLTFRQDGIASLRNGIASVKAFLESILYHKQEEDRARQLSILREYLESQKPANPDDAETPFLRQLWQAWSFAGQNNNDHIISSVCALLALLLRTLSSLLDFRDLGILLCRTVLLHPNLRLVRRGLDAPKHKDFVISPCLRLLTEVTSFDGGVMCREVYKRREQTFDVATLRRNLSLVRPDVDEEEARRKPSVRTLTVRYVLAHLKYLHEGGKADLLKSRPLCVALFHHLSDDPSEVVNDILTTCEKSVLKDSELPRSAKAALLLQHNLERITEVATRSRDDHDPSTDRAFAWLKAVCATPSYGVFRASGWYPPGTTKADSQDDRHDDTVDLGLDRLDFYDRTDRPDVRNSTLLGWIQTLRPQADAKERDLVLTCFRSAPELVAPYFAEKNMQFDPKLSNTWIGYAAFLFEVIRLPVPLHLGNTEVEKYADLPPQTKIMLENIIPRPLTQKVLTRCLNQSSELITFFAVRILVLAFQKVSRVLAALRAAALESTDHIAFWNEAGERLLSRFSARAPLMKDVINTFRKISNEDEHALQREGITRLLSLYYQVVPLVALDEQFDVSSALTAALARCDLKKDRCELSDLRGLELQHLLAIARASPGMKWFTKQGSLSHLPITSLLKLHVADYANRSIRALLLHVLQQRDIVLDNAELCALVASLQDLQEDSMDVWTFVDDCMVRANRQPVKYVDQLEVAARKSATISERTAKSTIDLPGLLIAAVAEQVGFVAKRASVVRWCVHFINLLCDLQRCGLERECERLEIARQIRLELQHLREYRDASTSREWSSDGLPEKVTMIEPEPPLATDENEGGEERTLRLTFPSLPVESDNHPEVFRWAQKDFNLAVEEEDVDALILCLCSKHDDIRKQAYMQLRQVFFRLKTSTHVERDQIAVLVGELIETFEQQYAAANQALPYLTGTFAVNALHVLRDPTHFIYPKLNRYLIRSPEWRPDRQPAYWLANTVLSLPAEDDGYWKEVQWVLAWLVDGLRSTADLEILRRGGVYEKVLALYCSPAASTKLVKEKVLELLWRATCVEGGSNTVITRAGALAWLDMVSERPDDMASLLRRRVLETCDKERIRAWSGVGDIALS